MTTTSSVSVISTRDQQDLMIIWANQQNGVAMEYHNRAAKILLDYTRAQSPKDWRTYEISEAERYAQMSLFYAANPRLATGTLYNLLRAQAIQEKTEDALNTIKMFRDNYMSENLRDAIINGDPDLQNIEHLPEYAELRSLYEQIKEHGFGPLYEQVRFGLIDEDESICDCVNLSERGQAVPIHFQFQNPTLHRLDNLTFTLRFMRPLALSGTDTAVPLVHHTVHGRSPDKSHYLLQHVVSIGPQETLRTRVEINVISPETSRFTILAAYGTPERAIVEKTLAVEVASQRSDRSGGA